AFYLLSAARGQFDPRFSTIIDDRASGRNPLVCSPRRIDPKASRWRQALLSCSTSESANKQAKSAYVELTVHRHNPPIKPSGSIRGDGDPKRRTRRAWRRTGSDVNPHPIRGPPRAIPMFVQLTKAFLGKP